jgi:hypothetical protein
MVQDGTNPGQCGDRLARCTRICGNQRRRKQRKLDSAFPSSCSTDGVFADHRVCKAVEEGTRSGRTTVVRIKCSTQCFCGCLSRDGETRTQTSQDVSEVPSGDRSRTESTLGEGQEVEGLADSPHPPSFSHQFSHLPDTPRTP